MGSHRKAGIVIWVLCILAAFCAGCNERVEQVKLCPVIAGDWWVIGPEPDLRPVGLQPEQTDAQPNQPNDHCIFQSADGTWHLWACVRGTKVGRILCHWEAKELTDSPWRFTGEIIRADKAAGESMVDWKGQEFIQSPFVVKEKGKCYMFYGGYDTALDAYGNKLDAAADYDRAQKQICLMTSPDGRKWRRHRDCNGFSRVFVGPGSARDECIVKFADKWYAYYAGHHGADRDTAGIYVRTSKDLVNWSDWRIAQYDPNCRQAKHEWKPESPTVVYRSGYYYLFRTHGPGKSGTWVFRSEDPLNFGLKAGELVTVLDVIAPEIIIVDESGKEYISNIVENGVYGIRLAKLKWEKEQKQQP